MKAIQLSDDVVRVTLDDGETLATAQGPGAFDIRPMAGLLIWDALVEAGVRIEPRGADVPVSVFDYQFAGEAEARGIITANECDAWVGPGAVPQTLLTKVEQLIPDPDTRRRVVLFLKGSKEFPRFHANTIALARLFGLDTDAKLDAFFIAAAQR